MTRLPSFLILTNQKHKDNSNMDTLVIPEHIIEIESTKLVNKLDSSNVYLAKCDSIGQNSIYEAKPSVLTFAGYEVKKTQALKLSIRNISSIPQRLSILPTTTPFFKPHYNKKGQLAPGMNETLIIHFVPPEWRYYYDCLRILTPAGNINIPIHAYPVMNYNERYIPALIDLGKCNVGQQIKKNVELESIVPVTFEYEIKVTEDHPDIMIGPVTGEVPGKGRQILEIVYTAHSANTASMEFTFMLSEFDYKPIKTRIIASASHSSPVRQEPISKNLLTGSKESFTGKKRLPELSRFTKSIGKVPQTVIAPKEIDRVIFEQQFNTEYRKIEEFDREKEFKIYVSVGDPHPTDEYIESVRDEREVKEMTRLKDLRKKDLLRNVHEIDMDKSIVKLEFIPDKVPTWNAYQNDEFSLRQLPLNRFVRAASTVIVRLRIEKRLKKIRDVLAKYNVKTRQEAREFVVLDWKQADLIGVGKQDFIPFSVDMPAGSIKQKLFPEQFSDALDEFKKNLEITPLNNFDTYYAMTPIEPQDFLLANYPDVFPIPASHYVPIEKDRELRQGAEEEYSICLEKGEFRDDPLFVVPSNANKPIAIDPVSVVRPHPSLRCYMTLSALAETSPEYQVIPTEILRANYEEYPGCFVPSPYMLCNKWRPKGTYGQVKIPEKMRAANAAEALSESDSDNENAVGIDIPVLENYLALFEGDDENIKLAMKSNVKVEATNALCEEIEKNKQKDIAWLPSQITLINKQITDPELKLSIL